MRDPALDRLLPAFATGPEGLFALWRWSGGISAPSCGFTEDPVSSLA